MRLLSTLIIFIMKRFYAALALTSLFGSSLFAEEANWNHWRGPNKNGSAESGNPPTQWNANTNLLWKAEIPGKGSSTPIVHDNQVFILTAIKTDRLKEGQTPAAQPPAPERNAGASGGGTGGGGRRGGFGGGPPPVNYHKFMIISYDRSNGTKLWEKMLAEEVPHESVHGTNNFASSSPVTDGKHIFVDLGSRGIHCLDMKGEIIWSKSLGKMKTIMSFGEGASAALAGDKLIVPWDHLEDSFVIALDKSTGKEIWRTKREEGTTWGTPLIVEHQGRTQIILNGKIVRSYDAKDGSQIWQCGGQVNNPIPSPIQFNDYVICMTGFRGNAIRCISLNSEGDVTDSEKVAWANNKTAPYVPTATLYRGHLYLNQTNTNVIACLDAKTGEEILSPQRLTGLSDMYASPVAANGHIYYTGRDGTTVVIKDGRKLEIVSTNPLGETIDASLAIVGDKIFARGESHLFCIGQKP